MELCKGDKWSEHEEICYDENVKCPLCETLALVAERDIEIKYYEKEIYKLENEIVELKNKTEEQNNGH